MRRNSKENIFSSNHFPIKRNSTADDHLPIIHRLPKDFFSRAPLSKLKPNPSNVDQKPPLINHHSRAKQCTNGFEFTFADKEIPMEPAQYSKSIMINIKNLR